MTTAPQDIWHVAEGKSRRRVARFIVVVLDGVGFGELPDAAEYGDTGSDTLVHVSEAVGGLRLPNLGALGLGRLRPIDGVPPADKPRGFFGRMREASPGKDSVTGHWEMMGIVLDHPFPTYPNGFPREIIGAFEAEIGSSVLGNYPASGTEIIERLGDEHVRTGRPIVYTSADSVFQVAAHEGVVPVPRLYEICGIARRLLAGDNAVGRVIARPFTGESGAYRRTENRRDFPLSAPFNALDSLAQAGLRVHAIGKISEFFDGRSITTSDHTTNNADHAAALTEAVSANASDFIFANFEDFDMLYGHRNDARGFADAMERFDAGLATVLEAVRPDDVILFTNDHGNDPTTPSTDHSREYAMVLGYSPILGAGVDVGVRESFSDLGATVLDALGAPPVSRGESFLSALRARTGA